MRIRSLDIGVESITQWQLEDEVHLPKEKSLPPAFLPLYRPLDEILKRPSLDERLPYLLQPELLDPDMLQPAALTEARLEACAIFAEQAEMESGYRRDILRSAAKYLDTEIGLDEDVGRALAALLRG